MSPKKRVVLSATYHKCNSRKSIAENFLERTMFESPLSSEKKKTSSEWKENLQNHVGKSIILISTIFFSNIILKILICFLS